MTYTLKYFLNVFHESIVKDRLTQFNVPEMSLALSCFTTCLAFLIHGANS